jgi:uncharacterized protein
MTQELGKMNDEINVVASNVVATTVLITGGTGFIGKPLSLLLAEKGWRVLILTRQRCISPAQANGGISIVHSLDEIKNDETLDVIINLAGEPLGKKRWSKSLKEEFIISRVAVTRAIVSLLERLQHKPEVVISGSAIGYYGPSGDSPLDENGQFITSYSHTLCLLWEQAAQKMQQYVNRLCIIRTGIVLGAGGGPFSDIRKTFDMKVASHFGSGEQWMSWIHLDDLLGIILFLIAHPQLKGVFNGTSPAPVTNNAFSQTLAQIMKCWVSVKVPGRLMRVLVGEMADEVLLSGQRVIPTRVSDAGYEFMFPQLDDALSHILNKQSTI